MAATNDLLPSLPQPEHIQKRWMPYFFSTHIFLIALTIKEHGTLISNVKQKYTKNFLYITFNSHECILTHWGRVTHICISKITIIGSDNGLSPGRWQAIIWTNAVILLIEPLGTNFSEILIAIHIFSLQKMHLNMSSGKWGPFCLGLNVLIGIQV